MSDGQEKQDSVFDFLYSDTQRISLFLAQFHQYGQLTALTKSSQSDTKVKGELGPTFLKGSSEDGASTKIEERYDSSGLVPLNFLDEASRRGLIVRSSEHARIGQLVLVTGSLKVLDLGTIKGLWSIPDFASLMSANSATVETPTQQGNRRDRRAGRTEGIASSSPSPMNKMIVAFMNILPHPVQGRLATGSREYWFSLKEQNLSIDSTSLMMKHGIEIAGEWSIVGVLDALPDNNPSQNTNIAQENPEEFTPLFDLLESSIAPMARSIMGRPATCFGLTPLLIFREVDA